MTENDDRWKTLEVWRLADELAQHVYHATKEFPKEEVYGITSQLRRAALSIPTNIVEGYSRKGDRELARFIDIALGSLAEVKYLLHFSHGFGYLEVGEFNPLAQQANDLGGKLWKFYERVSRDAKLESKTSRNEERRNREN
jgi:four helix bundle protein